MDDKKCLKCFVITIVYVVLLVWSLVGSEIESISAPHSAHDGMSVP